jgi:hypothetical protein
MAASEERSRVPSCTSMAFGKSAFTPTASRNGAQLRLADRFILEDAVLVTARESGWLDKHLADGAHAAHVNA